MIGIIGASGFIGQHLLRSFSNAQGISLRGKDVTKITFQQDVLLNLVGKAHDHRKKATEDDYYYVNFQLAKDIFTSFLHSSASVLIHVSSIAAVEEFESSLPLMETDKCRPTSWYGKSKYDAEEWLLSQNLPPEKKIFILRPPMVHGIGDKGNLALLYSLISKGIPFPLAAFNNERSFISMDNFCFFLQEIVENHNKLPSGIYHIADDEALSTKDIVKIIKQVAQRNIPDIAVPKVLINMIAKIGDVVPIPLNSTRLRKMTGNLVVSNSKIKQYLKIIALPQTAKDGVEKTVRSFMKGGGI